MIGGVTGMIAGCCELLQQHCKLVPGSLAVDIITQQLNMPGPLLLRVCVDHMLCMLPCACMDIRQHIRRCHVQLCHQYSTNSCCVVTLDAVRCTGLIMRGEAAAPPAVVNVHVRHASQVCC